MPHLLSYVDQWSVSQGQTIRCFVSCPNALTYQADLLRLIQPDAGPQSTPFRPETIASTFSGTHSGRTQTLPIGSHAVVPNISGFSELSEFTLTAVIFPTTPGKGRQALLGTWCEKDSSGVGLEIGADGALNVRVACLEGHSLVLSTKWPLQSHRWYSVTASFGSKEITLKQELLSRHGHQPEGIVTVTAIRPQIAHAASTILTMAAWSAGQHGGTSAWNNYNFAYHFNGRIEKPQILSIAVEPCQHTSSSNFAFGCDSKDLIFAAWDFSQNISENEIVDIGKLGCNGLLINSPARGVTGHTWSGESFHWPSSLLEYGAIHFHDDDLADACWTHDFEFHIPPSMRSGVYAIKLFDGFEEFWVPFIVRAAPGVAKSDTVLLLPTFTYIAYLNHRSRFTSIRSELLHGRLKVLDSTDIALIETPEVGLSTYDTHSDGSGVMFSSRRRPACNLRPTGHIWNFSLDLFIVDWLDRFEGDYDVITDEDLHAEGASVLLPYKVVITGSHPEYASKKMICALDEYLKGGGRLMYLGGNGFYWRTAVHPNVTGQIEVRRPDGVRSWDNLPGEDTMSFSGENSGIWRKNGRAPHLLVGVGYVAQGFDKCSYYVRTEASGNPRISWAFDGVVKDRIGDESVLMGGAAGIEVDSINIRLGTPEHALVIAQSEDHSNTYELASEEVLTPHGATDGLIAEDIHADMTFFETPAGGAVFSTGSIAYVAALSWNNFDNDLCRLTENVLRRFREHAPFSMPGE